jgi:hypothetical protein
VAGAGTVVTCEELRVLASAASPPAEKPSEAILDPKRSKEARKRPLRWLPVEAV